MEKIIDYVNETPYNTNIGILKDKLRKYSNELTKNVVKSVNGVLPDDTGNVEIEIPEHSWETLEGKPFGEEEIIISYDYSESTPTASDEEFHRVFDEVPNIDTSTEITITDNNGYSITYFLEADVDGKILHYTSEHPEVIIVLEDGVVWETQYYGTLTFAEKGVYFFAPHEDYYTKSISWKSVVLLDTKFLPEHSHKWEDIENPPFKEELEYLVYETTVNASESEYADVEIFPIEINAEDNFYFYINDVAYPCKVKYWEREGSYTYEYFLANDCKLEIDAGIYNLGGAFFGADSEIKEYKIKLVKSTVTPLDPKFLPEMPVMFMLSGSDIANSDFTLTGATFEEIVNALESSMPVYGMYNDSDTGAMQAIPFIKILYSPSNDKIYCVYSSDYKQAYVLYKVSDDEVYSGWTADVDADILM